NKWRLKMLLQDEIGHAVLGGNPDLPAYRQGRLHLHMPIRQSGDDGDLDMFAQPRNHGRQIVAAIIFTQAVISEVPEYDRLLTLKNARMPQLCEHALDAE